MGDQEQQGTAGEGLTKLSRHPTSTQRIVEQYSQPGVQQRLGSSPRTEKPASASSLAAAVSEGPTGLASVRLEARRVAKARALARVVGESILTAGGFVMGCWAWRW